MSGKHTAVFGIFRTRAGLDDAVEALKEQGFLPADISVLLPSDQGSQDFAYVKGSKAAEGGAVGAGTGVVVGGALGWLAGIGAFAVPGVGPLIAAGPIVAALAGAGVVGTIAGISGALMGLGIPEYIAKRYTSYVEEGGMLISVHVDSSELKAKAKGILENTGGEDIASTDEVVTDRSSPPKKSTSSLEAIVP